MWSRQLGLMGSQQVAVPSTNMIYGNLYNQTLKNLIFDILLRVLLKSC